MTSRWFTALLAMTLFCPGPGSAQQIVDGKLVVPQRRIAGFVNDGADPVILSQTIARIRSLEGDGPSSWIAEWTAAGAKEEESGNALRRTADREAALDTYMRAAVYYGIAGFPEYHTSAERAALMKQLAAYEKAGALMDMPLEVVRLTVRGKTIKTYFHRPPGIARPPLMLWTNGTDRFKGHAWGSVKRLVDMGFAVVTFDLPGTGESRELGLTPDGEYVHLAVLDHFAKRPEIDSGNIFEVGISFGGYFAAKMAARNDPRLRAVAAICGPVHSAFTRSPEAWRKALASPERKTVVAFAHRMGVDPDNVEQFGRAAGRFSLVEQGIIGHSKTIETPLLLANGGRDLLVPVTDMQLLAGAARTSEVWTFGMAHHCFSEYFREALPDIAEWLLQYRKP